MGNGKCPFAVWVGSPNMGYPQGTHGQLTNPLAVVDHIMCGTLDGCDSWFNNPTAWASSHFGIGKDGRIHQYVDLNDCAWGNGAVLKPDPIAAPVYTDRNPNTCTWSIEHEGYSGEPWTEAMYQADLMLKRYLWQRAPGLILLGHCHIDSVNKANCPGPTWPRERLLAALKGGDMTLSQIDENWVKAEARAIAKEEAAKALKDARLQALFKHPDGRIFQRVGRLLFHIPNPPAFVGSSFDWDDVVLTKADDPMWKECLIVS